MGFTESKMVAKMAAAQNQIEVSSYFRSKYNNPTMLASIRMFMRATNTNGRIFITKVLQFLYVHTYMITIGDYFRFTACFEVDLAFVIDTAGSIVKENWSRMTDFIDRVIAGMEVSENCARVSLVTFGSAATLEFDLQSYRDAGSLVRRIRGLPMDSQSRDFAGGIRKMRSQVFQSRYGDRKNATNMCVLVTDGTSGAEYAVSCLVD